MSALSRPLRALGRSLRLASLAIVFAWSVVSLPAADEQIIYPRSAPGASSATPAATASGSSSNPTLLILAVFAAVGGGWFLWRQRKDGFSRAKAPSKLSLAETRPLGNRQFLVVAAYEDKKFLLGVCPGRIELLTRLDDTPPTS